MRAGVAVCLIAVLVAVLIGSGRRAATGVLATAAAPQGPPTPPPTAPPVTLPHPTERQVDQPASLSSPQAQVTADPSGIPDVALAAYQRSAVVMGAAAPSCGIDWALLAAIGQVESDHGRANGSHLDENGVAHPPIVGPRLDGRHGTSRIDDTDAGRLDGSVHFDRAVGPMQFLPSTWAAVAVDGDDDGRRDVQDIDDAALGSAVYLCADQDDLTTKAGQRHAVLRYNHSRTYADRVLAIADELRADSVLAPTDGTVQAVSELPDVGLNGPDGHRDHGNSPGSDPSPTQPSASISAEPAPTPTDIPVPTDPPTDPPTTPPTDPPTDPPTEEPVLTDPLPDELADLTPEQVEAYNAAWAVCNDDLADGWSADAGTVDVLTQCLAEEIDVPTDDPQLLTFVDWLARTEDGATE